MINQSRPPAPMCEPSNKLLQIFHRKSNKARRRSYLVTQSQYLLLWLQAGLDRTKPSVFGIDSRITCPFTGDLWWRRQRDAHHRRLPGRPSLLRRHISSKVLQFSHVEQLIWPQQTRESMDVATTEKSSWVVLRPDTMMVQHIIWDNEHTRPDQDNTWLWSNRITTEMQSSKLFHLRQQKRCHMQPSELDSYLTSPWQKKYRYLYCLSVLPNQTGLYIQGNHISHIRLKLSRLVVSICWICYTTGPQHTGYTIHSTL